MLLDVVQPAAPLHLVTLVWPGRSSLQSHHHHPQVTFPSVIRLAPALWCCQECDTFMLGIKMFPYNCSELVFKMTCCHREARVCWFSLDPQRGGVYSSGSRGESISSSILRWGRSRRNVFSSKLGIPSPQTLKGWMRFSEQPIYLLAHCMKVLRKQQMDRVCCDLGLGSQGLEWASLGSFWPSHTTQL